MCTTPRFDAGDDVMKFLMMVCDWINPREYERALEENTAKVVRRFARGNVRIQNGAYMSQADLDKTREKAARVLIRLNKKRPAKA